MINNITLYISGKYVKWTIYNEVQKSIAIGTYPIIPQIAI